MRVAPGLPLVLCHWTQLSTERAIVTFIARVLPHTCSGLTELVRRVVFPYIALIFTFTLVRESGRKHIDDKHPYIVYDRRGHGLPHRLPALLGDGSRLLSHASGGHFLGVT